MKNVIKQLIKDMAKSTIYGIVICIVLGWNVMYYGDLSTIQGIVLIGGSVVTMDYIAWSIREAKVMIKERKERKAQA